MQSVISRKHWLVFAAIVSTLLIYFLVLRRAFAPASTTLIEEIVLGGLALAAVGTLLIGLLTPVAVGMGAVLALFWGLPPLFLARRGGLESAIEFHWLQDMVRFLAGF